MKVSRREFVGTASCAAAASLCSLPSFVFAASNSHAQTGVGCTLLDLEANCALPESLAGMRAMIGDAHRCIAKSEFISGRPSDQLNSSHRGMFAHLGGVVIVAGAGAVQSETFRAVNRSLERGATVLWESGAAFLNQRDFASQQILVREHFGISMERPIDVWSRSGSQKLTARPKNQSARNDRVIGHEQIPYVAYRWPREALVRDFSRVTPVSAAAGGAIAHWGQIPVAWQKPVGEGTLVFVGSPIGPALYAGDSDAHSLLRSMING